MLVPFFVIVTTQAAKNCSLQVKQKADIDMKRCHNVLHLSSMFFNGYRFLGDHIVLQCFVHVPSHAQPLPSKLVFGELYILTMAPYVQQNNH